MTEQTANAPVFSHYPVMLNECIEGLHIKENGIYVDCTTGGGGHSFAIASRLSEGGRLICIDQDTTALAAAKQRLAPYLSRVTFVHDNFSNIRAILDGLGIDAVDGALIDLGVSSYQLDTPERGFSYQHNAPLDMRMNEAQALSAYEVVNTYSKEALQKLIFAYGEERFAPRIAQGILRARETAPIKTTFELVDIIKSAIPAKNRAEGGHPAKRTFQAIRIEVNDELAIIEPTVRALTDVLTVGGRLCVITFHSLEDRIVKQTYQALARACTCPPDFPICVCGGVSKLDIITRKPLLATEDELIQNNRSHSAKLRIAQRI